MSRWPPFTFRLSIWSGPSPSHGRSQVISWSCTRGRVGGWVGGWVRCSAGQSRQGQLRSAGGHVPVQLLMLLQCNHNCCMCAPPTTMQLNVGIGAPAPLLPSL